jgi:hypothetical protein
MVYVIEKETTGKQSAKGALALASQKDICHHLEHTFPNYPIHFAADPKKHAKKH